VYLIKSHCQLSVEEKLAVISCDFPTLLSEGFKELRTLKQPNVAKSEVSRM